MQAYVGTLTAQGPVLCGGWYSQSDGSGGGSFSETEECFLLSKSDGTWSKMKSSLNSKRGGAAGVVLDSGEWWVTGGQGEGVGTLATTELWYNSTWSYSDPLPTPLTDHCMLQYNSTHTFLNGGWNGDGYTTATYWYTKERGYIPVAGMDTVRSNHACAVDSTGLIYVAGGTNYDSSLNTVEIYSPSSNQWSYGPDIPVTVEGAVMLTDRDEVIFIGGRDHTRHGRDSKKIWSLVKTDGEPTGWREVGKMKQERSVFSAIKLKLAGCEGWKL